MIILSKLKKMPLKDCYHKKSGRMKRDILKFLKKNSKEAFTISDIIAELNKSVPIEPNAKMITAHKVNSTLFKLQNEEEVVKRKGNYYYYNK